MKRRVVITGLGAVSPLGLNYQETWKNCLEGKSGAAPITAFDPKDSPVTFACEVKGFNVGAPISPLRNGLAQEITQVANAKEARKMGRFTQLGIAAGLEAYADAGLELCRQKINPERFGVNMGAGMGGLPEIQSVHDDFLAKGYKRITPFFIPQSIPNMISGQLSIYLNLQGHNLCNVTACSSSAHSIGESFRQIQRGEVELMLAGGAEAVICELGIGGFAAMRALSTRNDSPTTASRPFDKTRDGFVMGEGGAALILEELEHAKKRGARIYGEILGYGLSGDAYHMTSPAPEGAGGRRSMKLALMESGLDLDDIGYINAHGTSTPAGDAEEIRAVASVFPDAARHIHVSSTKSMTGHLLGAAGAIESLFCTLAVREGIIPPTINLNEPDPDCSQFGISLTPNKAVEKNLRAALTNSFGFGGTNASLIIGQFAD